MKRLSLVAALFLISAGSALLPAFRHSTLAQSHPTLTAAFDWTMPARFGLDRNSDGLTDYFPETSDRPGLTGDITPSAFQVNLDGCDSSGSIMTWHWVVRSGPTVVADQTVNSDCRLSIELPEGSYLVTLEVGTFGITDSIQKEMIVQDWLIVALGDSYGAGEGNPDIPVAASLLRVFEAAAADYEDAAADLADAIAHLAVIDADYRRTILAVQAALDICDWDNDYDIDIFDLPGLADCAEALLELGQTVYEDTLWLVGGILDGLADTAEEALDTATAARVLAQETFEAAVAAVETGQLNLVPTWQDRRCHRSALAGSAQAALALEQMDPRSSVTFVHLACSGAEAAAGLLNPYQGVDVELEPMGLGTPPLDCDVRGACIPAQIQRAAQLVGNREVDALYLSIGGNDAKFGPLIVACIILEPCNNDTVQVDPVIIGAELAACAAAFPASAAVVVPLCALFVGDLTVAVTGANKTASQLFAEGSANLVGLYPAVGDEFELRLPRLPDSRVFISEYPNVTLNSDGSYCPGLWPPNNLPGLSLVETIFADVDVTRVLDVIVAFHAANEGWNLVGGIYDAFANHGYCADDNFVVRLQDSFLRQGNQTGAVHPNAGGQAVYRDSILASWLPTLYAGGDLSQPRRPAQPPVADAGGHYAVDEGGLVQLDGSGSYSPDDDPFTYSWGPVAQGSLSDSSSANPWYTAPPDNGLHSITLRVEDDDGFDLDTAVVFVNNVAPTVAAGGAATLAEGQTFTRSVSYSDPGALDTHTATADFGDGTGIISLGAVAGPVSLSHVYADNGVYSVQVCVTDDDGGTGCGNFSVSVTNAPPSIDAGQDRAAGEGDLVSVVAHFSDPGTRDTHTATIDWGDGSLPIQPPLVIEAPFGPPGSTSGANGLATGQHVYADNGVYTVEVCATDDDGETACDSLDVKVSNVPPAVVAGPAATLNEGGEFALATSFTDGGTLDTHTATVNWGDGSATEAAAVTESPFGPPGSASGASGTAAASHVYADNGTYTVTVCLSDDDGETTCDTLTATVLNVAPTIRTLTAASGTPFALVRAPIDVAVTFTDPGRLDTHTAAVDWGDGSSTASGPVVSPFLRSHAYAAPDNYLVRVTVTDDDGGATVGTATIEVLDPVDAVDRVVDDLVDLAADHDTNAAARLLINAALDELRGNNGGASSNGAFTLLATEQWSAGVQKIQAALAQLAAARAADADLAPGFSELILAWTAKSVALDVIARAEPNATSKGSLKAVTEAKTLVSNGDQLLAQQRYAEAADAYQNAIGKVEKLL